MAMRPAKFEVRRMQWGFMRIRGSPLVTGSDRRLCGGRQGLKFDYDRSIAALLTRVVSGSP